MIGLAPSIAARLMQSWLAKMNIPLRNTWVAALIFMTVTVGFSVAISLLLSGTEEFVPKGPVFLGLALILMHFLSVLTAIMVTASSAQDSAVMAWWRSAPVSDRVLGLGWSIPHWILTFAQIAIAIPALLTVFGDAADHTLISCLTVCAIFVGTVAGRAAFVAARTVLRRLSAPLAAHAQGLATLAWVLCLAGAPEVVLRTLTAGPVDQLSLSSLLGYPTLVLSAVRASFPDLALLAAWLLMAVVLEVLLWPYAAAVRHEPSKVLRIGPAYSGGGRLPLVKLELTRLLRRRRIQAATLSTLVIQAGLILLFHNLDEASRPSFLDSAVLVNSILVAYAPLLARGMSSGSTPYPLIAGCRPAAWAFTVTVSGLMMAVSTSAPALVLWSLSAGDPGILLAGLGLASFTGAAAAITGFLLMPSDETGVGESMGMLTVGASLFLTAKALTPIGFDSLLTAGPVLGFISLGLIGIPSLIESLRWGLPRSNQTNTPLEAEERTLHANQHH